MDKPMFRGNDFDFGFGDFSKSYDSINPLLL